MGVSKKLLSEINESIALFNDINFECLIVNDASQIDLPELIKPNNLKSLEILNMKKNRGHARCNAFGIRYIFQNKKFDNLILMDGDGEDRPEEIKYLIEKNKEKPNLSVVAKELKDQKVFFSNVYINYINLLLLYSLDKILTLEIIACSQKTMLKNFILKLVCGAAFLVA